MQLSVRHTSVLNVGVIFSRFLAFGDPVADLPPLWPLPIPPGLLLPGSQGQSVEQALANIRETIEFFLETLTDDEHSADLSQVILTPSVEVHAQAALLDCRRV